MTVPESTLFSLSEEEKGTFGLTGSWLLQTRAIPLKPEEMHDLVLLLLVPRYQRDPTLSAAPQLKHSLGFFWKRPCSCSIPTFLMPEEIKNFSTRCKIHWSASSLCQLHATNSSARCVGRRKPERRNEQLSYWFHESHNTYQIDCSSLCFSVKTPILLKFPNLDLFVSWFLFSSSGKRNLQFDEFQLKLQILKSFDSQVHEFSMPWFPLSLMPIGGKILNRSK